MRLVVKKSDREHLRSCCNRQPIVYAAIDFQDELESRFTLHCPICCRIIGDSSFVEARLKWNKETWKPGDLIIPPKEPV